MTDRHEPLPGLFALPGFFYRRLSPAGRRAVLVLGALLLVGTVAAVVVLAPRIAEINEDNAERARQEAAESRARLRRELVAEQRPRFGSSAAPGRAAKLRAVEAAIIADAARRLRAGTIRTPVRSAECHGPRGGRRQPLACTAVTSLIPAHEASRGGRVGYPYRALVDLQTGRFAFCKVSGQPAEGALGAGVSVPLPRPCGG